MWVWKRQPRPLSVYTFLGSSGRQGLLAQPGWVALAQTHKCEHSGSLASVGDISRHGEAIWGHFRGLETASSGLSPIPTL